MCGLRWGAAAKESENGKRVLGIPQVTPLVLPGYLESIQEEGIFYSFSP